MNTPKTTQDTVQEETHNDLDTCTAELAQSKERLMYLTAEFDNYRRRIEKERTQWAQNAQTPLLLDIIALVDNFDRAHQEMVNNPGFEMIYKSFTKLLTKYGLEEITENTVFNPAHHEALLQVSTEDKASGDIVAVLQKGYKHKGIVLVPAKVSVAQ